MRIRRFIYAATVGAILAATWMAAPAQAGWGHGG
ncbi:hypothetical protein IW248_000077 [Micromonospora ureilytica]|uniref:Uncharacterized protein n=1 Tax=Micromonospora ureilytica TaxID=709868 RepID=A0ABS0J9R3_9ACTN|nr:hypothetical protein [Micromonospora ureilytica]